MKVGFTGAGLDRRDAARLDGEQIAAAAAHGDARLLVLDGLDPLVDGAGRLAWGEVAGVRPERMILLGFEGDTPLFAPLVEDAQIGGGAWHLFRMLHDLNAREAAIWGAARALNEWHARHRFCGRCGTATLPFRAGWGRLCSGCGMEHFPRVDPVAIMLAEYDGRVLVGRQPRYPARRYSALAGFIEPGESIEEAVARELMEEAGVAVSDVRYLASQPWPFPGSLMIGCVARAADDRITLDRNELEDAMWVDRAGVAAALAGDGDAPFQAPPHFAIAHSLLRMWLDG